MAATEKELKTMALTPSSLSELDNFYIDETRYRLQNFLLTKDGGFDCNVSLETNYIEKTIVDKRRRKSTQPIIPGINVEVRPPINEGEIHWITIDDQQFALKVRTIFPNYTFFRTRLDLHSNFRYELPSMKTWTRYIEIEQGGFLAGSHPLRLHFTGNLVTCDEFGVEYVAPKGIKALKTDKPFKNTI